MLRHIPYLFKDSTHRPYLELLLYNQTTGQSFSTLALVDSGADSTVIPYSIGVAIGLDPVVDDEELEFMSGVGGIITYAKRECILALSSADNQKLYCFKEEVLWLHPNKEISDQLENLKNVIEWCTDSAMIQEEKKYKPIIESVLLDSKNNYFQLMALFDSEALLGRPFFSNFEYIRFHQRDNLPNSKLSYKIYSPKVHLEVSLDK